MAPKVDEWPNFFQSGHFQQSRKVKNKLNVFILLHSYTLKFILLCLIVLFLCAPMTLKMLQYPAALFKAMIKQCGVTGTTLFH